MIFGLNLPNYSGLGHRDAVTAITERAEELGYASVWTSDHVLLPQSLPEPYGNLLETFTTLSYLAARTERIGLATGILVLPQRDPLLAAKQAATVHHLSGGRLTLGVGVGWIEQEYGYLRSDFQARGHTADEYIPAMRALFEEAKPEFHGPHIRYADVLFSPRPASRLPIVVGGTSRAALKRAATLGDGWHGIGRTPEEAAAALDTLDSYGRGEGFRSSVRNKLRIGEAAGGSADQSVLQGSAAELADQVSRFSDAGVEQLVLEPQATELDDFLDQITRFTTEVAARFPDAVN
jgi:probable F420-dependent oxidoreductase